MILDVDIASDFDFLTAFAVLRLWLSTACAVSDSCPDSAVTQSLFLTSSTSADIVSWGCFVEIPVVCYYFFPAVSVYHGDL